MRFVKLIDGPMINDQPLNWPDEQPWPEYVWFGDNGDGQVMISLSALTERPELHRYRKLSASIIPPAPGFIPGATYEYAPDGVEDR